MPKSANSLGANPLTRISPLSVVANVGDAFESRLAQFARQHPGASLQNTPHTDKQSVSTASVSNTAHFIDQSLKQAEAAGASLKYQAQLVITHSPQAPSVVAQNLKMAISHSGLFYESHLSEFIEGQRTLANIKQEPQSQQALMMQQLLPQQLHILEHQRLSWHGEVWPNQQMDWDIARQEGQAHNADDGHTEIDEAESITSDLTLHLPNLGKVTVKLNLTDARMRISVKTDPQVLGKLKMQSKVLATAIERNGQVLEGLTVALHE